MLLLLVWSQHESGMSLQNIETAVAFVTKSCLKKMSTMLVEDNFPCDYEAKYFAHAMYAGSVMLYSTCKTSMYGDKVERTVRDEKAAKKTKQFSGVQ